MQRSEGRTGDKDGIASPATIISKADDTPQQETRPLWEMGYPGSIKVFLSKQRRQSSCAMQSFEVSEMRTGRQLTMLRILARLILELHHAQEWPCPTRGE
nr:hypothetical protein CFP56_00634 [Quercus suber]